MSRDTYDARDALTAAGSQTAHEAAVTAADALREALGIERADLAVVLGSGWSGGRDAIGTEIAAVALERVPGFSAPVVPGHGGEVVAVRTPAGATALLFTGRTHLYEGRGVEAVVHGVRTAAAAGATTLVLTNGCGSVHPEWLPGTPVVIRDHINLTGATPLLGTSFVSMSDAYSPRLRAALAAVRTDLHEGVYVQFRGPQYETPAEVEYARRIGGDLVGMSTALETIAAREAGLEVLGLSLVTNPAAGIADHPLDHAEVIAAGHEAEPQLRALLADLVGVLG
ncbi:purine-nucleoside phosphorylase [Raineyella antarctica]|uniref:Purine nucleoside phosphorylase n=1 Tax=Raineyella antarctica TaxID=1577474 RepID=A0A1G6H4S2_9ACTN|nr:purine-nucleoside phosphorylase [Raineyella antarctica]SDB89163.1 purine-nucleoside phosphorylase [Raineyella antarctica]